LTAVYIKASSAKSCSLIYITQSDPGGSLPTWIVNKATKAITPKVTQPRFMKNMHRMNDYTKFDMSFIFKFVKKIHKACLGYEKWKGKQAKPYLEPWKNPEDVLIPKLDKSDIISLDLNGLRSVEDESQINEKDLEMDD